MKSNTDLMVLKILLKTIDLPGMSVAHYNLFFDPGSSMVLECVLELQRTLLPFPAQFKLEWGNGFG